jgi:hypothetical protein
MKWIKVEDRLPEDMSRVLILYKGKENKSHADCKAEMVTYYADFDIDLLTPCPGFQKVTHWSYIELPEE